MNARAAAGGVLLAAVLASSACGSGSASPVSGAGSCALRVEYRGHTYTGAHAAVAPREVASFGSATLPACADTGAEHGQGEEIELAQIEDIPPAIAVAWHGHDDVVLISEEVDPHGRPVALTRLLVPECRPEDEPIELVGLWRGIIGADGRTELDLVPPYDVLIRVTESSAPLYERAELQIRVPVELGRPLSRDDSESSFGHGGTLSLRVHCSRRRFVAERVIAHSPA